MSQINYEESYYNYEAFNKLNHDFGLVNNPNKYPYSNICIVKVQFNGYQENSQKNIGYGTGTFITPIHVLTCLHNLFYFHPKTKICGDCSSKRQIIFQKKTYKCEQFYLPSKQKYLDQKKRLIEEYDFAVLKINNQQNDFYFRKFIYPTITISLKQQDLYEGRIIIISGYPKHMNKEVRKISKVQEYEQYQSKKNVLSITQNQICHDVDTDHGSSGSPIMINDGSWLCIVGIHQKGKNLDDEKVHNVGVRFNQKFLEFVSDKLSLELDIQYKKMGSSKVYFLQRNPRFRPQPASLYQFLSLKSNYIWGGAGLLIGAGIVVFICYNYSDQVIKLLSKKGNNKKPT